MPSDWTVTRPSDDVVRVSFVGHLSASNGARSADALARALRDRPLDVIWDLTAMTGYDAEARTAWQRALWPLRANIRSLRVVGANAPLRFGARLLTSILGVPCVFEEAPRASLFPPR